MSFDFNQCTDKAAEAIQAAITLAKDYANGMYVFCLLAYNSLSCTYRLYPVHIAFVLLNEGSTSDSAAPTVSKTPLFASVINKAGGDPVRMYSHE